MATPQQHAARMKKRIARIKVRMRTLVMRIRKAEKAKKPTQRLKSRYEKAKRRLAKAVVKARTKSTRVAQKPAVKKRYVLIATRIKAKAARVAKAAAKMAAAPAFKKAIAQKASHGSASPRIQPSKQAIKAPKQPKLPGGISPEMLEKIKSAAHQTWDYIANDAFALEAESGNRSGSISRNTIIELVCDANRIREFSPEVDSVLTKMNYKDVQAIMKKYVFTAKRYG